MAKGPRWTVLRRWLFRLAALGVLLAGVLLVGAYVLFNFSPAAEKARQIDLSGLDQYPALSVVTDRHGDVLGEVGTYDRLPIGYDDIAQQLIDAVTSCEDRRFWMHGGIDPVGVARATLINLWSMKARQGGSTITQQLAKVYTKNFSRTFERKIVDMHLALRIEAEYSKKEILTAYLNRIYLGSGHYGVEAAARGYFGKSAKDLTLGECAMLAGIIPAPSVYNPRANFRVANNRRWIALNDMRSAGVINYDEYVKAWHEEITLVDSDDFRVNTHLWSLVKHRMALVLGLDPDKDELPGGLRVTATIDKTAQQRAATWLRECFDAALAKADETVRERMLERGVDAALAVLDAKSGEIIAYVGGLDFGRNQFDALRMGRWGAPVLYAPLMKALGEWSMVYEERSGLALPHGSEAKPLRRTVVLKTIEREVANKLREKLRTAGIVEAGQRLDAAQDDRGLAALSLLDFARLLADGSDASAVSQLGDGKEADASPLGEWKLLQRVVSEEDEVLFGEASEASALAESATSDAADEQQPGKERTDGFESKKELAVSTAFNGDLSAWAIGRRGDRIVVVWTGYRGPLPIEAREVLEPLPLKALDWAKLPNLSAISGSARDESETSRQ